MATSDLFLGTWQLVPELSLYAAGTPPESGLYVIAESEPGLLSVQISWRMPGDSAEKSMQFGGRSDGSPVALPATPGAPDAFTLTRVDSHTLDSAALRAGEVVSYARRVASADGTLLAVVQESGAAAESRVRNFQVYRRATGT
jgi:hypothetical protein